MESFSVAEKFVSINGEGPKAGELAVFLRFFKCNLNCGFCDTRWAREEDASASRMTTGQLLEYVQSTGVKNVTLTGGEPLLQEGAAELITELGKGGFQVEIETNGSVPLEKYAALGMRPSFTMDYKLPGSGMEEFMRLENFACLEQGDTVKFVVGDAADLSRAEEVIRAYDLTSRCHVYLSPVYGKIHPAEIVDFMRRRKLNRVRLQLQLHKFIWEPDRRGV